MEKHFTPGRWEIEQPVKSGACIGDLKNNRYSAILFGSRGEENEANARLIAAAPEMFAMLEKQRTNHLMNNRVAEADEILTLLMKII